eukprot:Protomagalhaensia_wolfi_Nauph_80__1828@NODE_213_length_3163_cov_2119_292894_g56_i1_p1_GENE_NODE_213_length_3163_cov_2119_292894_g56_i1NODE_213_length_3163_cov_2119_292894_g56_i1_p1_ORF_typecomplete_len264_score36_79Myosin_tail_1/PF01576_19/2_4e05HAP1_N/PF04849_13/6_2e05KIAA1328/PF15369_6/0_00017TolA_bind_tri/PF16331_5/0_0015Golgin_A5/PF09787_9/0_0063DivIVA/PF05103_13/1_5e02DivIVA/PF05103_13/0_015DivIVA/PF05103_13/2e03Cep57_CLD_2/PF14197_6/4_2e02Cep57_CLD_2/PF14197_6/9_3Cep57_CLD_2/PF14197_6/0_01
MSFWQCAVGADREVKSSLDTLCLSEAETWSKLSTAMLTSESLKATKNVNSAKATAQRRVDTLAEESERKNQLILNLSKQLNEARESHAALLNKVEALTKQLEMLEAQNLTLSKEKEGITKELVVAQNTVRKLYKEAQAKKTSRTVNERPAGSLLAPPALWKPEARIKDPIKFKGPVLPPSGSCAQGAVVTQTPEGRPEERPDTGGVEVLVDQENQPPARKRSDRKAAPKTRKKAESKNPPTQSDNTKEKEEKKTAPRRTRRGG